MVHAAPEFGVNHYRLKQVDYDGTFAYSDIVSEEYRGSNDEATAYPNPFDQSVTVQFPSTDNVSSSPSLRAIKIYDVYGKLVHSERVSSNAPTVTLKLPNLSNGTYFLHTTNGHETLSTLQIVKD
jgi:hypothetical protein